MVALPEVHRPAAWPDPSDRFDGLMAQAERYAQAGRADASRRAYSGDLRHFAGWCAEHGLPAFPATPDTVTLYVTDLAGRYKPATIQRRLAALSQAHRIAGYDNPTRHPTVQAVLSGVRRSQTTGPAVKAPLLSSDLRRCIEALPDTILGQRDRALLLVGFAGGFRRSELVALDVDDLQRSPEGVAVRIRRSKTDQEGIGRTLGIPHGRFTATCPVIALDAWLDIAGISVGPLFRPVTRHGSVGAGRLTAQSVARVVKRSVAAVGLDSTQFAGHSLRAGLATSAAAAGASERSIMNQTGHRSVTTVRRYIRDGQLFHDNAAAAVGL